MTACLLSLLVFPGAGHVYLKRVRTGIAIMAASLVAFMVLLTGIFRIVRLMLDDFANGLIPADTVILTELITQRMHDGSQESLGMALTLLLCLWIGSIVDAVRIGMQEKR